MGYTLRRDDMKSGRLASLIFAVLTTGAQVAMAADTPKPPAKDAKKIETPVVAASVSSVGNLAGSSGGGAAAASYARTAASADDDGKASADAADAGTDGKPSVNNINGGMPNRISTNVTVPKQTQGATFGEKVNQGLHAAGGALSQGAAVVGGTLPGGAVISASVEKDGEATTPEPGKADEDAAADPKQDQ
jgi:hypothetical protein